MNAENTYLIAQPIFGVREENGKKLLNHCAIINYGEELKDGTIVFVNKDGEQRQKKGQFESSIKLFKLNEICLDNLMSKWSRINNENKPIVLDESIESQEVYEDKFSHLRIMVERRKDCVAIKPLFV